MNATEVNESLAAVRDIEARAAQMPVPWGMVTAVGLTFGLGVGIMVAGYVWGLLVLLVSLVLMIVLDFGSKRTVRTAMKQDVQQEENSWSWKRFLSFLVLYTIAYIGMQVYADHYPDGNTTVGIVVGIIAAAAMIAGYGLTWRKYH
ncbi:hypothetical protein KBX17_05815 [Corynebacterium sp. CCUG 65737]|uniref:hypothetical protein n=1 Tax=Corynebacterium sp. CCUG 65737 TaxID=2823889 RepID=UPI00210B3D52|nr:hypothetical protein [Corynebacterium sp. CCUG 65737]MCQ4627326.1 hypothetical protein [Corynebacterium sp. CCUG 65737]